MTLEEFNKTAWRPGMSVVHQYKSVNSPYGIATKETKVSKVEFDEGTGYAGIIGPLINGSRQVVPYSQIIKVVESEMLED